MLIDTEDAVTLSHLTPMERQMLRSLADRLRMLAWTQAGWTDQPPATARTDKERADRPAL